MLPGPLAFSSLRSRADRDATARLSLRRCGRGTRWCALAADPSAQVLDVTDRGALLERGSHVTLFPRDDIELERLAFGDGERVAGRDLKLVTAQVREHAVAVLKKLQLLKLKQQLLRQLPQLKQQKLRLKAKQMFRKEQKNNLFLNFIQRQSAVAGCLFCFYINCS